MIKKKKLIIIIFICVFLLSIVARGSIVYPSIKNGEVFLVEWFFRDNYSGNIIGNPDFKASFDKVDKDIFVENFTKARNELAYNFEISEQLESNSSTFSYEILLDELITLKYSEGFIILSTKSYDENRKLFHEVLESISLTLSPESKRDDFPTYDFIESYESYKDHFYPGLIDYRFYNEDNYEVHIEDMKMGH